MRTIPIGLLVAAVALGACGSEAPAKMEPAPAVKVDPNGAALVAGVWTAPDGAGCSIVFGFNDTGSAGQASRICYPGVGLAQVSREYGPFEVTMGDTPDVAGAAKLRRIAITVKDPTCSAIGDVLSFDAQIAGASMVLAGTDGARALVRTTAEQPAVDRILFGCFAADGSFAERAPKPL